MPCIVDSTVYKSKVPCWYGWKTIREHDKSIKMLLFTNFSEEATHAVFDHYGSELVVKIYTLTLSANIVDSYEESMAVLKKMVDQKEFSIVEGQRFYPETRREWWKKVFRRPCDEGSFPELVTRYVTCRTIKELLS